MPFVPMDHTVQAELVYMWNGQVCQNVLQFRSSTGLTTPIMEQLGTYLVTWYDAQMKSLHNITCQLTSIRLTDMTTEFSPGLDFTTGLPIVGTLAGESLPNNVSISMSKRTLFRGRSYRGRIYQVGMGETMTNGNSVLAGTLTSLITKWKLLMAFPTAGTAWEMVVASKYEGGNERTEALLTPVINISSDGIIDSQRRRLPGRGN